ncbi:Nudix hydrolase 21, chloroplastic [Turnera subulata]|uniref:Nudix hydrolase 21, chloroplastic n=1 Tax=Turnera subulata TaxID=218843 RepID=A0A9Q0FB02_9ROSI|nr:Nudix hydrolase 21, chloroplastic [Turnera subulata]
MSVEMLLTDSSLALLFPFIDQKLQPKSLPAACESIPESPVNMVALVSRTGRDRQRYNKGCRQVVGCIPYRYKKTGSVDGNDIDQLEVLVISAQKGPGMLFPKGGWELDESIEEAALRETQEEAGVTGKIGRKLGSWPYMSKRGGVMHEGHMFPLLVQEQHDDLWPEKSFRQRRWVSITEAREVCHTNWMLEALEKLIQRQVLRQQCKEGAKNTRVLH